MIDTMFWWRVMPVAVVVGILLGGSIGFLITLKPEDLNKDTAAACDHAVHRLLTTNDMVELERSKYLIGRLSCGIQRRLEMNP